MFNTPEEIQQYLAQQAAWQNQLANGANIANTGWQTALGLALGTGLGNWLGHQFGNWQRARDDKTAGINTDAARQAAKRAMNNLFGTEFDLGWKPQYQFPTAQELFANATTYNPNWRQNFNPATPNASNVASLNQTPATLQNEFNLGWSPNYNFATPQVASGVGWNRTPTTLQKFF